MNYTLENQKLKITVDDHGAELTRVFDKQNDREVLWQADPKHWKRHAPVLFPHVGKYYGGGFRYNGKLYPTGQHGFARDMEFTLVQQSENSITHRLTSTAETLEKYPFSFVFDNTYVLEDGNITVKWHVENSGENTMYFTIGAHPAFNVPILPDTIQSDYSLMFHEENVSFFLLDDTGTVNLDTLHMLNIKDGLCRISEDRFDRDALILEKPIDWAGIALPDGTPYVSVSCPDFPNFGIWSAPRAPFVCLEPWDGRTDDTGFDGEISEKSDIITLEKGETYDKQYTITVY